MEEEEKRVRSIMSKKIVNVKSLRGSDKRRKKRKIEMRKKLSVILIYVYTDCIYASSER